MSAATIGIIAPRETLARGGDRWADVVARWPGSSTPRALPLPLEDLVGAPCPPEVVGQCDAALVHAAPMPPDASLFRLLDTLEAALVPAVVLLPPGSAALATGAMGGSVPMAATAESCTLSAVLFAMAARQETVRFLQRDLRLTDSLRNGAAAEVNRLHEELLLAAHVQRELLPKAAPTLGEVEASAVFRPCDFVSGDIYDTLRLDEHHIGFFLADAMGHGLSAALMTFLISANVCLKQTASNSYRLVPPCEAIGRLNRTLCASKAGPARVASAVCGTIDCRTRAVTIAGAGHPSPLLIGPETVRSVDASGLLLGVIDSAEYGQTTLTLKSDESLLLFSDGAEEFLASTLGLDALPAAEPRPLPERFRPPRRSIIRRTGRGGGRPLRVLMEALTAELDVRSGSLHQADDITIIGIGAASAEQAPVQHAAARGRSATA